MGGVRRKGVVKPGSVLFLAAVLALLAPPRGARAQAWQTLKSEHFVVLFGADAAFAAEVARRAEEYYRTITWDLGITRHDGFWLWQNRTRIYLHPTKEAFARAAGAPAWAGGKASCELREIHTFDGCPDFLDSLLPHELTHLVFRDFVGAGRNVPLWLEEGAAQWEERSGRRGADRLAREMLGQGRFARLGDLMGQDVRAARDRRAAEAFYVQALSLVAYLAEQHGRERFRKLCGQLRSGKAFEEALRFTYPDRIRSIAELESKWHAYLREEAP
jgi:hypothetical protein